MQSSIKKFLLSHEKQISPLEKQANLAFWNAALTGKKHFYAKYEKLQIKLQKIYNNKSNFNRLKSWKNSKISPLIKRQVKVLYDSFLSCQGDLKLLNKIVKKQASIERKFNTFRAKINNKKLTDNEIKNILETQTNSEKLKQAWEASKKQGSLVEKELIELVNLRNQHAVNLGFKNYYEFSLSLNEQKPSQISSIFKELDNLTKLEFKKIKSEIDLSLAKTYKISVEELKPWHYHDLFFQEAPKIGQLDLDKFYKKDIISIAKTFYWSLELPVEDILARSDLYEKPGKYQHACCMNLDRGKDIRIIENIKNNGYWMDTTLHELGHAVYDKFISSNLPYFLRVPSHIFTTEAIAMMFGRLSTNPAFIQKFCKISPGKIVLLKSSLEKSLRFKQLVFSRWSQVMVNFEKSLYEIPSQNLNLLWWNLVKKYQLINFSRESPDWASKIHLVSSPVYYQNYLLGELLASQLHSYISKNILKENNLKNIFYSSPAIGDYLKKYIFSPGTLYSWDELIKKATLSPLSPEYFVEEFVNSPHL